MSGGHFQAATCLRRVGLALLVHEVHLGGGGRRWRQWRGIALLAVAGVELITDRSGAHFTARSRSRSLGQRGTRRFGYTKDICGTRRFFGCGTPNNEGALAQHALFVVYKAVVEVVQVVALLFAGYKGYISK